MDFDKLDKINRVASDIRQTEAIVKRIRDFIKNIEGFGHGSEFSLNITGTRNPGYVIVTAPVIGRAALEVLQETESKLEKLMDEFKSM